MHCDTTDYISGMQFTYDLAYNLVSVTAVKKYSYQGPYQLFSILICSFTLLFIIIYFLLTSFALQ